MYLIEAKSDAVGPGNTGANIQWTAGAKLWIADELVGFYQKHPDVFTISSQATDPVECMFEFPGTPASAYIDFNATGEAGMSVTIGGVVYQEADTAVPATGVWTNGSSAANSAASLIAAINGDARAAVPFTAVADLSTAGVWLFWDEAGETAEDFEITTDSSSACTVTAAPVGGAAAGRKKMVALKHTIATQELLSGAVEIPLPFAPGGFHVSAFSSTGAPIYFTNLVTVQESPHRIRLVTNGATALANTNVAHITAWE